MGSAIEKHDCNICGQTTNHFIRAEHSTNHEYGPVTAYMRMLIVECCGCEMQSFLELTADSENTTFHKDPVTGEYCECELVWTSRAYPPPEVRNPPAWLSDLPDSTLRDIFDEIYLALQAGASYLVAFGSRTIIDRLIVLTVGDQGNFKSAFKTMKAEGKISEHEEKMLSPIVEAGHAAAHRAWAPNSNQLSTILATLENLVHRLLVLPVLTDELGQAVPKRPATNKKSLQQSKKKALKRGKHSHKSSFVCKQHQLRFNGSTMHYHPVWYH